MRRGPTAAVALLVAACNTGAASAPVNENSGAETKTRLRAHVWSADDVELLRWFYDSKRKEDCAFVDNGIAHTGPGPTYWCLPRNSVTHDATGGLAVFADARCTVPLALANPQPAASYVILRGANTCTEPLRVFRAEPAQTVTPYVFDGTKCAQATTSVGTHALGEEIPLESFVSAVETVTSLGGPIARLELVGSDGSRQTIGGFDEARKFAVSVSDPGAKGDPRWFPTRLAFEGAGTVLYRDAACKTTVPTKVARDALCPLGASFLFDGMCGEGTFYALGDAVNVATLYEKSPLGACVASNEKGVVAYERGAELPRSAFAVPTQAFRGAERMRLRGWGDGPRQVIWTDLFDSKIGETCTPEEGRCLPGGSASVALWADVLHAPGLRGARRRLRDPASPEVGPERREGVFGERQGRAVVRARRECVHDARAHRAVARLRGRAGRHGPIRRRDRDDALMIVRFSLPNGIDARGVAAELAYALAGVLAEPIRGDRDRASFSYLWLPEDSPEAITVERIAPAGAVKTAYRDEDPRSVWLLRTSSHHRDASEFTERLNALGAGDIRCFTEEEWENR